jgi:hypothetical protein
VKWGDELGFDDFDSDIVDKTLQGDLFKRATKLTRGSIGGRRGCEEGEQATL